MSEDIPQWVKWILTLCTFGIWALFRIAAESDDWGERAFWEWQEAHR